MDLKGFFFPSQKDGRALKNFGKREKKKSCVCVCGWRWGVTTHLNRLVSDDGATDTHWPGLCGFSLPPSLPERRPLPHRNSNCQEIRALVGSCQLRPSIRMKFLLQPGTIKIKSVNFFAPHTGKMPCLLEGTIRTVQAFLRLDYCSRTPKNVSQSCDHQLRLLLFRHHQLIWWQPPIYNFNAPPSTHFTFVFQTQTWLAFFPIGCTRTRENRNTPIC